jgi:hypothetical protein
LKLQGKLLGGNKAKPDQNRRECGYFERRPFALEAKGHGKNRETRATVNS